MSKRKEVEGFLIKMLGDIFLDKDDINISLYKELFAKMSDADFDKFMCDLRDGKMNITVLCPPEKKLNVTVKNNIKVGKSIGFNFFQRIKYGKTEQLPAYMPNEKYLLCKLPFRRMSQLLSKKMSVPTDNKAISSTTGQVTGDSRNSAMTFPEINVLSGIGANHILEEILKTRGGDIGQKDALNRMLQQDGEASLDNLKPYSTGTMSNQVLDKYLLSMHIRSTIYNGKN